MTHTLLPTAEIDPAVVVAEAETLLVGTETQAPRHEYFNVVSRSSISLVVEAPTQLDAGTLSFEMRTRGSRERFRDQYIQLHVLDLSLFPAQKDRRSPADPYRLRVKHRKIADQASILDAMTNILEIAHANRQRMENKLRFTGVVNSDQKPV